MYRTAQSQEETVKILEKQINIEKSSAKINALQTIISHNDSIIAGIPNGAGERPRRERENIDLIEELKSEILNLETIKFKE